MAYVSRNTLYKSRISDRVAQNPKTKAKCENCCSANMVWFTRLYATNEVNFWQHRHITTPATGQHSETFPPYQPIPSAIRLDSYIKWSLSVPPGLTFTNSTFSQHSVFMCFVWISEQTAIISLYSINWFFSFCAFAQWRKKTTNFAMYVRLYQCRFHQEYFREISYWGFAWKSVKKNPNLAPIG
jgi:hypothetical protein